MNKIDEYNYMYHGNIVNKNRNKNSYSSPHTIHIYKCLYKIIKQINIRYVNYTNTYVELIQNIFIKLCTDGPI